jgi:Tol biopolymer transport system component
MAKISRRDFTTMCGAALTAGAFLAGGPSLLAELPPAAGATDDELTSLTLLEASVRIHNRSVNSVQLTKALLNPTLAFSPDGNSILFCRRGVKAINELWRLPYPAGTGDPERLRINPQAILQGAYGSWMPDNRHLVISSGLDSIGGWHLAFAEPGSSRLDRLTAGTADESHPVASPDGQSIVYAQDASRGEVISASLEDGSTKTLVSTSSIETAPTWSATGNKLAWISYRNGMPELWVRLADGSERPVVTAADLSSKVAFFMSPSFSRDGSRVLYPVWNGEGDWQWITSLSGSSPVRLTDTQATEYGGSWSPDGGRFVYLKNETDSLAIMMAKTTGNATPTTLVSNIALALPDWSPTGEWITYLGPKGWTLISPDGKTTKALGKIDTPYLAFSKDGKMLYGILTGENIAGPDHATLFSLDLQTGKRRVIKELGKDFIPAAPFYPIQLSLTPDGKSLTYSTYKQRTDLWMLTGYRQPGLWNQIKEAFHLTQADNNLKTETH